MQDILADLTCCNLCTGLHALQFCESPMSLLVSDLKVSEYQHHYLYSQLAHFRAENQVLSMLGVRTRT